jgi:hypothetical protein
MNKKNKNEYPKRWAYISTRIRVLADDKCEICDAENGKPHPKTKSIVRIGVHHLDCRKDNNNDCNLIAVCQRCHARLHAKQRAQASEKKKTEKLREKIRLKEYYATNREKVLKRSAARYWDNKPKWQEYFKARYRQLKLQAAK